MSCSSVQKPGPGEEFEACVTRTVGIPEPSPSEVARAQAGCDRIYGSGYCLTHLQRRASGTLWATCKNMKPAEGKEK